MWRLKAVPSSGRGAQAAGEVRREVRVGSVVVGDVTMVVGERNAEGRSRGVAMEKAGVGGGRETGAIETAEGIDDDADDGRA